VSLLDPQLPNTAGRDRLAIWLQVASLLGTGWFIWNTTAAAQWFHISVQWLLLQSALAAGAAWAASAAITLTLYALAMQWERADAIKAALRTSAVAVWFAPAVILLSQLSPMALAGALVLVIYTTRLLYSQWQTIHPAVELPTATVRVQRLFVSGELPEPRMWTPMAPALTASFCVQTGVVATIFHYPLLAGIGYAMSAAVVTVFALGTGAYQSERNPTLPRSALGVLATILLAIGLTVGGLAPRLMRTFGWADGGNGAPQHGLLETARAFLREVLYGEHPGAPGPPAGAHPGVQTKRYGVPDNGVRNNPSSGFGDDGFPGVILWPEVKPIPTLIAPMPQMGSGVFTPADMHPLSIPFSGEYWMFRWPYARPPGNSYFQRGNPAALSFSTTDHRPMQMEAHHKLQQTIDLSCCSRIQLAIRNADRFPGTISVDLFLLNTELPGARSQSLGSAAVVSAPDTTKDPVTPVTEILDFAMPATPALEAFDEFKVVFIRDRKRMDKSAKVSIDRFILVPR